MSERARTYGVAAEFASPEALLAAVRGLRSEGFTKMDAFTPFPVHGLDQALGLGRSRLGYLVFGAGFIGMVSALLLAVVDRRRGLPAGHRGETAVCV